ncbi:Auxin-responsive protein SAUR71 [Glycine max]|nr:Auxin-responsive protein SAUR71 [Glycine max]
MEEGRKGYVPVLVGKGGHNMEKIWVSIKAIQHPTIVELLDQSADELGYQQGLLRIIYDVDNFKAIVDKASKNLLGAATSKLDMVFETKLAAEFCLITNVIFESDCCRLQVS